MKKILFFGKKIAQVWAVTLIAYTVKNKTILADQTTMEQNDMSVTLIFAFL